MAVHADLLAILVCPVDKSPVRLKPDGSGLKCETCKRVYSVKDDNGVSTLFISRKPLLKVGEEIETIRLAHNIYLARD